MWLIVLSDQLPIVALVGPYPANQLIGRGPLPQRRSRERLSPGPREEGRVACGINRRFRRVSPTAGQVIHVLRTRPPLAGPRRARPVRLACVTHAASVCPEPGSNSPFRYCVPTRPTPACGTLSMLLTAASLTAHRASRLSIAQGLQLKVISLARDRLSPLQYHGLFPLLKRCCFSLFSCQGS